MVHAAGPDRVQDAESRRAALVLRVVHGDEAALEALYRDLEGVVYGLALRILGEARPAEEVTVEVFTRLWRRASTYDRARGSVLAWVLQMARSLAVDALRARRHAFAGLAEDELEGAAADPADRIEADEVRVRVARALHALPREQERALRAAFFGGLSHREVAEALGEPLGTIKTRIRAALTTLRRSLASEGTPS